MTHPTKPRLTTILPHDYTPGRKLSRAEIDDLYGFEPLADEPAIEPYPSWLRVFIWGAGIGLGMIVAAAAIWFFGEG